jgi:DNA replication protein DnaC
MTSRYTVYKEYGKYKQQKDNRDMDDICVSPEGFQLQVQQSFLKDYISKDNSWRSLLLYHQIGSGKTCTAITLAEKYMEMHPNTKVTVVLPARLKTNFLDELISPCGMERYISAENFAIYHNPSTSAAKKAKIRREFMAAINARYNIMSFETFKLSAFKSPDLRVWVEQFTKDRLIIVDEVHNLITNTYITKAYEGIERSHRMAKAKGSGTILFKYLNKFADKSCKMLYLTATPIFDNIAQFHELIKIMKPNVEIPKGSFIKNVIGLLRGSVSFFPGTSVNAYPKVTYVDELVPISRTQDMIMHLAQQEELSFEKAEGDESFKIKQRMASIACLPRNEKLKKSNFDRVLSNMKEFAPKIKKLIQNINQNRGKNVVYTTFVASSIDLIEEAMRRAGWVSWKEVKADESLRETKKGKVYAIWDGRTKDEEKLAIKALVNSKQNMTGDTIRVILGSPSIKEGVSFKHIQHLHMLDPVWNNSAKNQVEGRAVRFCSHIDIPKNHEWLKREVQIHLYKSTANAGNLIIQTADQVIYDDIIPKKQKVVEAAENALKKVAIDYHLFKRIYSEKPSPKTPENPNANSVISVEDDSRLKISGQKGKKCPRRRRPNNGECPEGTYLKNNAYEEPCCYKRRGKANKSPKPKKEIQNKSCPKPRRPIVGPDGSQTCPAGFVIKQNKNGDNCCYKRG